MASGSEVLQFYLDKAAGGQYTRAAVNFFMNITKEDLAFLLEYCKKLQIAWEQNSDFKAIKDSSWGSKDNPFKDSRPTKNMLAAEDKIAKICAKYNVPKGVVVAWGAFIQAKETEVKFLSGTCWSIIPAAQALHYSKGIAMVRDFKENAAYYSFRMACCFRVVAEVKRRVTTFKYIPGDKANAKQMTLAMMAAFKTDVTGQIASFSEKLTTVPLTKETAKQDLAYVVAAAFPVRVTMLLQSRDLRKSGDPSPRALAVCRSFAVQVAPKINSAKINIKDKTDISTREYYVAYSEIRFICATMRRVLAGNTKTQDPKKSAEYGILEGVATEEEMDFDFKAADDYAVIFGGKKEIKAAEATGKIVSGTSRTTAPPPGSNQELKEEEETPEEYTEEEINRMRAAALVADEKKKAAKLAKAKAKADKNAITKA